MKLEEQLAELDRPLDQDAVKKRKDSGKELSYVEGWYVIAELNRIFGFAGWAKETNELTTKEFKRSKDGKEGVSIAATARVTLTVTFADGTKIARSDVGSGSHIVYSGDWGAVYEKASKEADTDALKRAARTLGNRFGLSLYDKGNPLHKGDPDSHGREPEEPPEDERPARKAKVQKVIDLLLELAAKIDSKALPGEVTAWLDGEIKSLDELSEEDMKRLVGTKKKPGTLIKKGVELRDRLENGKPQKRDAAVAAHYDRGGYTGD